MAKMDATSASFNWTSVLIQDPTPWRRMVLKRDTQDTWTCTLVDIPKVTVRRMPVEDVTQSQQVRWFPCLTDDSDADTNTCVSPPQRQVTTKKRVAVAKRTRGPASGWMKSMRGFLHQQSTVQSTGNKRPVMATCPGKSCQGQCSQGVNCKGERPAPGKHHLILNDEDLIANKRTCILLDGPNSRRMIRRKVGHRRE